MADMGSVEVLEKVLKMSDFIRLEEELTKTDVRRAEEEAVTKIRKLEEENDRDLNCGKAKEQTQGRMINELTSGIELLHYMEHSMDHRDSGEEEVLQREDLVISAHGNAWQIAGGKLSPISLGEEATRAGRS